MNPSTAVIDTKSLERMMALSISQQDAENILASNPLVDIEKALNIVEKRLKNKSAATLQSPIGYFKRALKESYSEPDVANHDRSEEHTSELQSLMRISYAVFCLKQKNTHINNSHTPTIHKHSTATSNTN